MLGAFAVTPAARATPSASDLNSQLSSASQQLEGIVEQYDAARVRLAATQRQRAGVIAQLVPLRQSIIGLEDQIGRYAAGVYMAAGGGPATALLGAESPDDLLDQLAMLDHLAAVNRRQVAALGQLRQQYEAKRTGLDTLVATQSVQQADLAAKRVKIESQIADLSEMRLTLYGTVYRNTPKDAFVPPYVAGAAGIAVRYALAQIGKPYVWGAAGPDAFDCSGLTMMAWRAAGVLLPHSSVLQWAVVAHLSRRDLQPGDLVFYYGNIQHVALYLGGGKVVHAPNYGERVSVAPLDLAPIYGFGRPIS
jgi:cell wall-associated NlpC family hydrolase